MSPRRRCLVTGGARSGKSHWAEQQFGDRPVRYLATGYPAADPEWAARVQQHRARRPQHWETLEILDIPGCLHDDDPRPVIVDCLTLWLTRTLDEVGAWKQAPQEATVSIGPRLQEVAQAVASANCDVVLVTNEVGSGVVPAQPSGRLFADLLGELNRRVAQECEEVVLMVAGIPLAVKGAGLWPAV